MVLRQFLRYASVGVANTAVHFAILGMLVEMAGWHPLLSNAVAFLVASALSFQLNARFTFVRPAGWGGYVKFVGVALLGLAISSAAMHSAQRLGWHYVPGAALGMAASVSIGFVLTRALVFAR